MVLGDDNHVATSCNRVGMNKKLQTPCVSGETSSQAPPMQPSPKTRCEGQYRSREPTRSDFPVTDRVQSQLLEPQICQISMIVLSEPASEEAASGIHRL